MSTVYQSRSSSIDNADHYSRDNFRQYLGQYIDHSIDTDGEPDNEVYCYQTDGRGQGKDRKPSSSRGAELVGGISHSRSRHGNRRDEMVIAGVGSSHRRHGNVTQKPESTRYQRSISSPQERKSRVRDRSSDDVVITRSVSPHDNVVRKQKVLKKHQKKDYLIDYSDYDMRVRSFKMEPVWTNEGPPVELLASHGLYYTGQEDITQCFKCLVLIECWTTSDDPLKRHFELEPNCKFLREQYQESIEKICLAKFSFYKIPKNREASFQFWPIPRVVNIYALVESGWFYTGKDDITRCFNCGCRYEDWKKGDDPLAVHRELSSKCSFIPKAIDYSNEESRRLSFKHYPTSSSRSVSVTDLVESGFYLISLQPQIKVKCYCCDLVTDVDCMEGKGPGAIHLLMSPECKIAQLHDETASLPKPFISQSQLKDLYKPQGDQLMTLPARFQKPVKKGQTLYSLPNMRRTPSPIGQELTRSTSLPEEEDKLCVVCLDNSKQYAIVPCGHLCVCHDCSTQLLYCPMCRVRKEDVLRIYNS